MTNYNDLSSIPFVQQEINHYVFNKEKPNELAEDLTKIITDLLKQKGFNDWSSECIHILRTCLIDFYKDLLLRFKQQIETLDSSVTFQDAFERTLDDIMSINLRELSEYMTQKC